MQKNDILHVFCLHCFICILCYILQCTLLIGRSFQVSSIKHCLKSINQSIKQSIHQNQYFLQHGKVTHGGKNIVHEIKSTKHKTCTDRLLVGKFS